MITLTITADTPAELHAQLRSYVESRRRRLEPELPIRTDAEDVSPTNDDYRRAITSIPSGKVASYSVVSQAVRGDTSGSQKVAGLAANDGDLETAYRVVKRDGSIAAGFRLRDGRMGNADVGRQRLEEEGIQFDNHGRALGEFMLTADELRATAA